eukprot:5269173-Prymnesium_polylepis.1
MVPCPRVGHHVTARPWVIHHSPLAVSGLACGERVWGATGDHRRETMHHVGHTHSQPLERACGSTRYVLDEVHR